MDPMAWRTEEFGTSHEGRPCAALADGSEPPPVTYDVGSATETHETSAWWIYDGTLNAPRATALRGACSCGWRGRALYPIDWARVARDRPYRYDTAGPCADWRRHISEVEARTVPLPVGLEELLHSVEEQLRALADDAPVAALKVIAALERITRRVGLEAARRAEDDALSWETIAQALGVSEKDARALIARYTFGGP